MSETETSIRTPEGIRLYPGDKLEAGALCYVCGERAVVACTIGNPESEDDNSTAPLCLKHHSRAYFAAQLGGSAYKTSFLLAAEDMVPEEVGA